MRLTDFFDDPFLADETNSAAGARGNDGVVLASGEAKDLAASALRTLQSLVA